MEKLIKFDVSCRQILGWSDLGFRIAFYDVAKKRQEKKCSWRQCNSLMKSEKRFIKLDSDKHGGVSRLDKLFGKRNWNVYF